MLGSLCFYNHNDLANLYIQLSGYGVKRSAKVYLLNMKINST